MKPVSDDDIANTRRNAESLQALILRRLAAVTQERAAARMELHSTTISRFVSDRDLERCCQLLAAIGLQVSAEDAMVVEPEEMRALKRMACKYLQADLAQDSGRFNG